MSTPIAVQPILFASDPWMEGYAAVWNLLNSKPDFVLLFGQSPNPRQVRLDDPKYFKNNPDLDNLAKAAFPRVRVAITEIEPATERDSSTCEGAVTFEIQIWTAVQQQRLIIDASWIIFRAMIGWRQYVMDTVRWLGKPCIYDVDARKVTIEWPELEGRGEGSDKRDSKGYEQWIGVYQTRVAFYFRTIDLLTY